MNYFVIDFIATKNGSQIERGKIGSVSGDKDYRPNTVKNTIEGHYRTINPNVKTVAVVLNTVTEVSKDQYYEEAKTFVRLGRE